MRPADKPSELRAALAAVRPFVKRAALFSLVLNLLVLAPTWYMFEVYGRVVDSRNAMTLLMLTLLVVGIYAVMEACDWVRREILHHGALHLDAALGERLFEGSFEAMLRRVPGASGQAMKDFQTLREFFASSAMLSLIDLPLALPFLTVLYVINPVLGHAALAGGFLQAMLAWMNERAIRMPLMAANRSAIHAQEYANASLRNAQVIEAMGMLPGIHRRWMSRQQDALIQQAQASDRAGAFSAYSRFVQTALSSLLLGLGCWLVLQGELFGGGGMMIVASMLGGKFLGSVVQVIGIWKQVVNARDAFARLDRLLQSVPPREAGMPLPPPQGALAVEGVVAGAPGSTLPIIRGISFRLPAGEILAIVGPSASGKTTLARLMVGIWPTISGKVRLDGVDVHAWNKAELGPYIGYLPQGVELFDGTLAENIARFGEPDMAKVEAAARAAGVHEFILALAQGYDARIGEDGCFLSGGQRQRIGLARALYGDPAFVVLDEPNSSLDEAGEHALVQALRDLKARGGTAVVITHRSSVLPAIDRMLVLRDGQIAAYGPRDEVLAALQRPAQPPVPAARPVPVPA